MRRREFISLIGGTAVCVEVYMIERGGFMAALGQLIGLCAICLCIGQARAEQIIIGTGTFLNQKGDLLTNRHVIDGCKSLAIRPERNKVYYPARVFAESSKFDLAVIRETGYLPKSVTSLSVNSERYVYVPTPGMKLLYGGYDNPLDPSLGINISNGEAVEGGEGIYVSRMRSGASHGASGSGVFDNSGNMVGVVYSGYLDAYRHSTQETFYGYNVINFYNNNAVAEFLQKEFNIELFYMRDAPRVIKLEVVGKIFNSTALIVCDKN
jgi:serine protease Do